MTRSIVFLSDFGYRNEWVGICHADLEPGEWGLMVDPRGWLSVVRGNPANAAEGLGVSSGDLVWLAALLG
jgi:hypothetical protein